MFEEGRGGNEVDGTGKVGIRIYCCVWAKHTELYSETAILQALQWEPLIALEFQQRGP